MNHNHDEDRVNKALLKENTGSKKRRMKVIKRRARKALRRYKSRVRGH